MGPFLPGFLSATGKPRIVGLMMPNNAETARRGREAAIGELRKRGFRDVEEVRMKNRWLLRITRAPGDSVLALVKTRTAGTWQGSIDDSKFDPADGAPFFWIFVDLPGGVDRPRFHVVESGWMARNIDCEHERYLQRHGGERMRTKESKHHAIQLARIAGWRDRWDLLDGG